MTVVGAGISGLACAKALQEAGHAVRVLDRGRRPGGRLGGRHLHGRAVDLGASYFTVSEGSPFAAVVEGWIERGLAREWTGTFGVAGPGGLKDTASGPMRYGAPAGLRSLLEDLAGGLHVVAERVVESVLPAGWTGARPLPGGEAAAEGPRVDGVEAEAVVLAMPDPQALRLLPESSAAAEVLAAGEYEPALAVALGWDGRTWDPDLHGAFVNDSPVLTWIADDGDRRGDGAPVLVAHTTAAFARRHLNAPDTAIPAVETAVREILDLPAPAWTHVHRWTFARPVSPRDEPFHLADGIGLCGDSWHAPSKVESAYLSGHALGLALGS